LKLQLSSPPSSAIKSEIRITGSKSETNRLLLLKALYPNLKIENKSNSDDAQVMQNGVLISHGTVDIHHAGTAMRFLTSFFAGQQGKEVILTGSHRMKERPIKVLVEALRQLGADIEYLENEGYPPLSIKGKKIEKNQVSLPANISSQYISSLCLIAPSLKNGLTIDLVGKITSVPYIKMTLALLEEIGVKTIFEGNTIRVFSKPSIESKTLIVESDWSAASYYYSIVALADKGSEIKLSSYKRNSLQGDSALVEIYQKLGVQTEFSDNAIILKKVQNLQSESLHLDLQNAPDIAQTIAVTCFGLGIGCHLTGLHTLPIKETDRLSAMKAELQKFGASVLIDHESLMLKPSNQITTGTPVDTYNDHRMAMAFAPLALKVDFAMNNAEVVSKSYPDFWNDMEKVGFTISRI
jgi:3-phosphoshikimate 1-carboxyvinyltransferase